MPADDALEAPQEGMTLPQRYFVSDEIFAEETGRLFHGDWFCLGRRDQLSSPGDFFLADVAGESVIVTLDAEGKPRAVFNVCRHRGSRLTEEAAGRFAHCRIRCPYHRWTYDCGGSLLAAPNMQDDFDVGDWPLHSVELASWQGFLFVNLSATPRPIAESFAPYWNQLDPWRASELRVAHQEEYDLATNWKMVFQNFNECYHCRSIHPGLDELSPVQDCSNDFTEGRFLGGPMQLSAESMTSDGKCTAPTIGSLDEKQRRRVYYYTLLPNLMLGLHPDFVIAWRLEPKSPSKTRIIAQWLYEPEAIRRVDFDAGPAVSFWDKTNRQDWAICQSSYLGVASKAYRPGPWSTSESIPRSFDRSVLDALDG